MEQAVKNSSKKTDAPQITSPNTSIPQDKIFAYCGYKLVGNNLVATGNYNPVPYQGL